MEAILALEDGRAFRGRSFGAVGERGGEVVFNTSMTGYQEILTDPSYRGQIVVMTAPQIGNYGVNDHDEESARPQVEGFAVREISEVHSNWRSRKDLPQYLKENDVVGISEIDTRALTRHLRSRGVLRGVVSTVDHDPESLSGKARGYPAPAQQDLVARVSCSAPYIAAPRPGPGWAGEPAPRKKRARFKVVAYDFGIKGNILRCLEEVGCRVTVVPAGASAVEVLALQPSGVFLSNGPGDPEALGAAAGTVRELLGRVPVFGICLGHQILALACGGRTYKLKFGHRGANHPVMNLEAGRVEITAQNHGYSVDPDSLPPEMEITHVNLNDGTLEGMRHRGVPAFSVQYHPEASPGPHDASYLFHQFAALMGPDSRRGPFEAEERQEGAHADSARPSKGQGG
ncbi:MAG TPA: glutamine-hydrolyzing carbamoyl-phosphate synthase small subunit [Candidatus Polarisedimenticolia bacterium]|nr:glutamine-hydrolyzing carbamoyl-phosphate synthase small subunit [Candidatus Polarisedimenticolia bacterium]